MLIASISIFCRKRTTGASSTSAATSCDSTVAPPSSSVTSKSNSPPASDSIMSFALLPWASIWRISLSCSTITHSGESWVANLMRSAASWSVGSEAPMKSRLPRLPSTSSWYWCAVLASTMFLGSFCRSTALRSTSGSASAADKACASSSDLTAPAATAAATKPVLRSRADLAMSSAALALSLPALTSTLATPVRDDLAVSTTVSAAMGGSARGPIEGIIADPATPVNAGPQSVIRSRAPAVTTGCGDWSG